MRTAKAVLILYVFVSQSADDISGVAGDNKLLVGGDNENLDLGVGGGDHYILAALGVCLIVDFPPLAEQAHACLARNTV